jgi:hypothetical protein
VVDAAPAAAAAAQVAIEIPCFAARAGCSRAGGCNRDTAPACATAKPANDAALGRGAGRTGKLIKPMIVRVFVAGLVAAGLP